MPNPRGDLLNAALQLPFLNLGVARSQVLD
jgi:hypothetical protein